MANGIRTIKDVIRSSVKVPEFDKHLMKAGGNNNKEKDTILYEESLEESVK